MLYLIKAQTVSIVSAAQHAAGIPRRDERERVEQVASGGEGIVTPANGSGRRRRCEGVTDTGPLHVAGGEPVMLVQLCISSPWERGELIISDRADTPAKRY